MSDHLSLVLDDLLQIPDDAVPCRSKNNTDTITARVINRFRPKPNARTRYIVVQVDRPSTGPWLVFTCRINVSNPDFFQISSVADASENTPPIGVRFLTRTRNHVTEIVIGSGHHRVKQLVTLTLDHFHRI